VIAHLRYEVLFFKLQTTCFPSLLNFQLCWVAFQCRPHLLLEVGSKFDCAVCCRQAVARGLADAASVAGWRKQAVSFDWAVGVSGPCVAVTAPVLPRVLPVGPAPRRYSAPWHLSRRSGAAPPLRVHAWTLLSHVQNVYQVLIGLKEHAWPSEVGRLTLEARATIQSCTHEYRSDGMGMSLLSCSVKMAWLRSCKQCSLLCKLSRLTSAQIGQQHLVCPGLLFNDFPLV